MGLYMVELPFTFTLSQDADGIYYIDDIPVAPEGESLITFNNIYWPVDVPDPGEIIIAKTFEGLPAGVGFEDVSFLIQGFDAQKNEIYKETISLNSFVELGGGKYTTGAIMLPAGNYTVSEIGGKPLGAFSFKAPGTHHDVIVSDGVAVDQFINKYSPKPSNRPSNPNNPNDPNGIGGDTQYEDAVKTGDPFNLLEYDEMLMMSLTCLGLVIGRKNISGVIHKMIVDGPQNIFSAFINHK